MEGPASRVLQEGDADWKEIASYHLVAPVRFNVGAPHLCHPKQKPGVLSRAADSLLPVEFMVNCQVAEARVDLAARRPAPRGQESLRLTDVWRVKMPGECLISRPDPFYFVHLRTASRGHGALTHPSAILIESCRLSRCTGKGIRDR